MQRACRRTRGTGLWKLIKRKEKRKFDQFACGDSGELLVLLFICMSRECTVSFRDERRATSERTNEDVVEIATGLTCRSRIPKASRNSGACINSTGSKVCTFWRFIFINFLKEKNFLGGHDTRS